MEKRFRHLSVDQALEIARSIENKERKLLIERIGRNMFEKICRLGFITEGATADKERGRVAVYKFTSRQTFTEYHNSEYTQEEIQLANAMVDLKMY